VSNKINIAILTLAAAALLFGQTLTNGYLRLVEVAAPGTPASGEGVIYVKTDGTFAGKNDAGVETVLGASGAFDPLDEDSIWLREEFASGAEATDGDLGDLGWEVIRSGAGVPVGQAGEANHPGIWRLVTGTTSDQYTLVNVSNNRASIIALSSSTFESKFIARQSSCADVGVNIGWVAGGAHAVSPTTGIYVRLDTADADTNYQFVVGDGTEQINDTAVACNTNWNLFRLYSTDGGTTMSLDINGSNVATETLNIPTAVLSPAFQVQTRTTADKTLDLDFFAFETTLTR